VNFRQSYLEGLTSPDSDSEFHKLPALIDQESGRVKYSSPEEYRFQDTTTKGRISDKLKQSWEKFDQRFLIPTFGKSEKNVEMRELGGESDDQQEAEPLDSPGEKDITDFELKEDN
jgi:hypothetical protein